MTTTDTTSLPQNWEKQRDSRVTGKGRESIKFLIGFFLLIGAIGYLIISGTLSGARYFITVDELLSDPKYVGQTVRISGAVIGDSIVYDSENLIIDFTIVNVPDEGGDLAVALHNAVTNPSASRLAIHIENEVMPDLLQHEAQAILAGELGSDGVFYASELLLKCPSRYEESVPEQVHAAPA